MVDVPLYSKIDESVKNKASLYVKKCNLAKLNKTKSLKQLIEVSLLEYMKRNDIEGLPEVKRLEL